MATFNTERFHKWEEETHIPKELWDMVTFICEKVGADISDEHTITMYNRGGYPYGYGKGFSFTYCTSSYADGPSVDYSKVLLKWLKGLGFRIENSYGDNGMDSSTNWQDTFWTYEFICDETVVDDYIFMDYKDEDYD